MITDVRQIKNPDFLNLSGRTRDNTCFIRDLDTNKIYQCETPRFNNPVDVTNKYNFDKILSTMVMDYTLQPGYKK